MFYICGMKKGRRGLGDGDEIGGQMRNWLERLLFSAGMCALIYVIQWVWGLLH